MAIYIRCGYNGFVDKRFDYISSALTNKVYSRLELFDLIFRRFPTYSANSCNWIIGLLCEEGKLSPLGNGYFTKGKTLWKAEFSDEDKNVIEKIQKALPRTHISCVHSRTLNQLTPTDRCEDFLLIEVDKRDLFACYMELRNIFRREIMLTPTRRELNYYFKPKSIILNPLFSKSPCRNDGGVAIEKLVVDILANRTIGWLYPNRDFESQLVKLLAETNVNLITALNYAKRRGTYDEVYRICSMALPKETQVVLGGLAL